jgi:Zn-dependent protease with chaperone function
MFANFIYFIIVLLIYSTHIPLKEPIFAPLKAFLSFISLIVVFACLTWMQFRRLEKSILKDGGVNFDYKFETIITRQSVLAILVFAVNIYVQNLTLYFKRIHFFAFFPSFQAMIFIGIFVFYLCIIWYFAFRFQRIIRKSELSLRSYLLSNILFSVPVLIPWFLLSFILDLINFLPFESVKLFLSTTHGEIAYIIFFLFIVATIGPVMIRKFWRCTPLGQGGYRQQIEELCEKAGVTYADILLWPIFGGGMITAGVLGLVKKFRYILVTSGLLRMLEPQELDAVIAHEIGHIKHRHMFFYLFFFLGYMFLSYASLSLVDFLLYFIKPVYLFADKIGFSSSAAALVVFNSILILTFLIYFRYVFGYFLRNFERQADIYVYKLFQSAQPLISTFNKIALTSGQSEEKSNWHHFSIKQRIDYLEKCENDRSWVARHNRKVKNSIYVFILGMVLIGGLGYSLNFGVIGMLLSEKLLLSQVESGVKDSDIYIVLGDIYSGKSNFKGAVMAYDKALKISPDSYHALNNLAWLYATCKSKEFFRPQRALVLAKKAAELKKEPYILDTLAQSYYVNGMYKEAVASQERAIKLLKLDPGNRREQNDYEGRLKKFVEAANR